jgi:hypothetical protein
MDQKEFDMPALTHGRIAEANWCDQASKKGLAL